MNYDHCLVLYGPFNRIVVIMVTSISVVIVVNRRFDCQILVQTTPLVWENVVERFKIMVNQST